MIRCAILESRVNHFVPDSFSPLKTPVSPHEGNVRQRPHEGNVRQRPHEGNAHGSPHEGNVQGSPHEGNVQGGLTLTYDGVLTIPTTSCRLRITAWHTEGANI